MTPSISVHCCCQFSLKKIAVENDGGRRDAGLVTLPRRPGTRRLNFTVDGFEISCWLGHVVNIIILDSDDFKFG